MGEEGLYIEIECFDNKKKRLFDQSVNRNQSIVFIMVWLELRKLTVVTHTYRPT